VTGAWATIDSPLGELVLEGDERGVTALRLPNLRPELDPALRDPSALVDALDQVGEYFAGRRRAFDLALAPAGGDFDLRVWRETSAIPYRPVPPRGGVGRRAGRLCRGARAQAGAARPGGRAPPGLTLVSG
jgi:methylated-DNA-[protein]-cysteine S-methyltransferase